MNYIDPNGEEPISIAIVIVVAVAGGAINVALHWNQIDSFLDGLAAFGIGAGAGIVGVYTGGAAFVAAGGGVAGAGGAWAGIIGGLAGYAVSAPVQNVGNHLYFGDPLMTIEEYATGLLISGGLGGAMNGLQAAMNGRNFFTGELLPSKVTPMTSLQVPTAPKSEINAEAVKPKLQVASETAPAKTIQAPQTQPQNTLTLRNPGAQTEYERLLESANNLSRVKSGTQAFVKGDGASIFETLSQGGLKQANGTILMPDGTILF